VAECSTRWQGLQLFRRSEAGGAKRQIRLQRAAGIPHYPPAGDTMNEDLTSRIVATLDRLEAGQGSIRDNLTRLEAGQGSIRDNLTRLEAGQGSIRDDLLKTRAEIMERIDRLQNTVTSIHDDIAVNMGAVDSARLANDNTREDVKQMREQMSVMWRQLKAVQARVDVIDGRH
jgi:chromosome segregation ATPase